MIINSLTLENFKSHKYTKLEFNENISLILGSNGAGKSSILEAISYSFFKEFTGTITNLIRKPAEENDIVKKMEVTVEFTHDGNQYKLKRGKTKSKSIAELRFKENDKYIIRSNGDSNVTHDIESILSLDAKSFLNAVYIKQGDITDLIEKRASERKELIAKLLSIDSFEKAWEEIKSLIDIYTYEMNVNDSKLSKKEDIEEEIKTIESFINNNTEKLEEIKPLTEKLNETVLKLESEVSQLKVDKTKYDSLLESLEVYNSLLKKSISQKENDENKLKEIEENEEKIKIIESEVKPLPHLEELKENKNRLDATNSEIEKYNKEIDEIKKNIKIRDENKEFNDKLTLLNEEMDELREKRKKLSEDYLKYEGIKAQIKDKKLSRKDIRDEIQEASENATKLLGEYFDSPESIEKKVNEEKEKTEQFIEDLTKKIHDNEKKISARKNELDNTRKSLDNLEHTEDTCPICQSEISHEKHEELSVQYKENIVNIELEIEQLEQSNKNQDKILNEKKNYLTRINNISIDVLKSKNNEFITLNRDIKRLQSEIPEEFNDDELLKNMDAEIEEKNNLLNNLKEKSDAYLFAVKRLNELNDIEVLTEKVNELNEVATKLRNQCKDIVRRFAVKDNLEYQIKFLKKQNDELNKLKGIVQNKEDIVNNINNMNNDINTYNETIENTEKEIENLNYDSENYNNKKETCRQNKEKLDENKKIITELETEIKKDQENINNKNNELKELEEIILEQNNLKDYIKTLNALREIYSKDGVQKDLRENVRPLIEKETLDIFNEFDFDYSGITLDSDYDITLHNKKEDLTLNMVSGGEKIVIALALRLGIAKVLSKNKTDLLILDEPTIHLDEERRSRLIEIIGQINFVPQMIVVTHDDEMETLSNNIIKIRKQNGISSIDNS